VIAKRGIGGYVAACDLTDNGSVNLKPVR